jgi:hypothetical protein
LGKLLLGVRKIAAICKVLVEIVCNASYRKLSVGGKTTNWRCGNKDAAESYIVNGSGKGREVVGRLALGELKDAVMEQREIFLSIGSAAGIAEVLLESRGLL